MDYQEPILPPRPITTEMLKSQDPRERCLEYMEMEYNQLHPTDVESHIWWGSRFPKAIDIIFPENKNEMNSNKEKKGFKLWLYRTFCWHDYQPIDPLPYVSARPGETLLLHVPHKCIKCGRIVFFTEFTTC
jgi:hypothetical protein